MIHRHLPIESPRSEESRVEHIRPIGGCHQNDTLRRVESVHFDQQLIERLLTFIVPTAEPRTSRPSDGVDLIDKNDTGCMLLCVFEQGANARGPNPHEHFDEIRPTDTEERDARLAGNRLGQ